LLRQPGCICIDRLAECEFIADAEDLGVHGDWVALRPVPTISVGLSTPYFFAQSGPSNAENSSFRAEYIKRVQSPSTKRLSARTDVATMIRIIQASDADRASDANRRRHSTIAATASTTIITNPRIKQLTRKSIARQTGAIHRPGTNTMAAIPIRAVAK